MSTTTIQSAPESQAQRGERVETIRPPVNIHHHADGFELEAEMPGVSKQGVEITFEDGRLTLVGRRDPDADAGEAVYRERPRGDYRRVFDLDPSIDAARIEASIEQGLLTVRLPKAEAAKPRKIEIR